MIFIGITNWHLKMKFKTLFISLITLTTVFLSQNIKANTHNSSKIIQINAIQKQFKKQLAKRLNKKECEKKIFLKKAKLSLSNQEIIIEFTPRITRGYCTRRARQKIYEKTKNIKFSYKISALNGKVVLTPINPIDKQQSFERSLTDVIGKNSKIAIAEMLLDIVQLDKHSNQQVESIEVNTENITVKYSETK